MRADDRGSNPPPAEAIYKHLGVWQVFNSEREQRDFCDEIIDALAEAGYIVVERSTVARALARGDMFRTPAAAGARTVLREAAGIDE